MRLQFTVLAFLLAASLSGCGSDHDHARTDEGNFPGSAQTLGADKERAADLIIRDVGTYAGAKDATRTKELSARLVLEDAALEALFDAGDAMSVAARAIALIDEDEPDAGRAARVKGSAAQVRAMATCVQASAESVLRAMEAGTWKTLDAERFADDRMALKAALRALKVDVVAMEKEAD